MYTSFVATKLQFTFLSFIIVCYDHECIKLRNRASLTMYGFE